MKKLWGCVRWVIPAFLLITVGRTSYAQLEEQPIAFPSYQAGPATARTLAAGDTIELPFWDDFSTTIGQPNSDWWAHGPDVWVNPNMVLHPPTLGVATFDGLRSDGIPHNGTSNFVGPADSLTSKAIDLSVIPANLRSTVFLSFFWQIKGLGELPNVEDSLRLQFLDRDSTWVTQWVLGGGEVNFSPEFEQQFVAITQPEYYHEGFRFRFQGFNKQTGPFDHWHIDYVYLNQNRSLGNNTYPDMALSSLPSSPLNGYYALPPDQLRGVASQLSGTTSLYFFDLEPPTLIQPIEYNILVTDPESGDIITVLDENREINPVPRGQERRLITSSAVDVEAIADRVRSNDSLVLEMKVFIKSGDRFLINRIDPLTGDTTYFESVDFRDNDTTNISMTFSDYTAWDDGTAEYAAGINQARGQLAYKVVAPAQDTLTAVDIHFPQIAPFAEGQPLDIIVWKTLTNINPTLLAIQRVSVQFQNAANTFVRYKLETPLVVKDTFFIGYRQYTDNFVGIGLDKNNDTGVRIYYNVGEGWVQNDRVEGSLMFRPVFEKVEFRSVTGIETPQQKLSLFPNPSTGVIHFSMLPGEVVVTDISGKIVFTQSLLPSDPAETNLSHLPKGIYFVHCVTGNGRTTLKLLLTN